MSWTSLDEYEGTSTSDEEDIGNKLDVDGSQVKIGRRFEESKYLEVKQISPCNPYIQEPNSDNEINSRNKSLIHHQDLQNLIAAKDERIRVLQKLVNGQREQLYHFLNMSLKEETLLELKKTCRETEALNQNENMAMALDKFKYENHLPTEQTLVRKDVSKTLFKIERLMRHQMKLVKIMESGGNEEQLKEDGDKSVDTLSCYRTNDQFTEVQKLFRGTKSVERKLNLLKIQLKKLALIEEERIDLVERVYSMPPDQRQYYAQLAVIEREKIQLLCEIDKLNESYRDLKEKCSLLEETENELNRSLDTKLAGIDFSKIKPGLERHIELMDILERGEMSMITTKKNNENFKFGEEFMKFYNEKAEISMRLKNFDQVIKERDECKEQIEILVENSLRLQNELKDMRVANSSSNNRNEELLKELRQVSIEREELRGKVQRLSNKEGSSSERMKIHDEILEKMIKERDQLRIKLAEYRTVEEDFKYSRLEATKKCEEYRTEIERLKNNLTELEDKVKTEKLALLDKNEKNFNINVSKEFEKFRELEEQKERLVIQISRYKYALLRQEAEIKDLLNIIEKLIEKLRIINERNPAEGIPENLETEALLTYEEQKRLDTIQRRIRGPEISATTSSEKRDEVTPTENNTKQEKNHNTIINSIKYFLGLDDRIFKTTDH